MNVKENGLDSFRKSVSLLSRIHLEKGSENYEFLLKDAIISLHHSTETLFKYLVKDKNEYLLYTDLENLFKYKVLSRYKQNTSKNVTKTIEYLDAIHRVLVLYDIELEEFEYKRLDFLNKMRNSLTHFEWEFEQDLAEHTIALILPTLLEIYKEHIDGFNQFAIDNSLYVNIDDTTRSNIPWNLERLLEIETKIIEAKVIIARLENCPKEKEKIFKANKTGVEYINCPLCNSKKFLATGNVLINSQNTEFIGHCEYCSININNQDAHYMNLNFNKVWGMETYSRISSISVLREILDTNHQVQQVYDGTDYSDLERIFKKYEEIIQKKVLHVLQYLISDIDEFLANQYFEDEIYYFNDITEDLINRHNSRIEIDNKILFEKYKNDEKLADYKIKFNNIILNYIQLSKLDETHVINKLEGHQYSESYHNAMYKSWEGEDIEAEITIRVNYRHSDFIKLLQTV